jgi:hypothetical protein
MKKIIIFAMYIMSLHTSYAQGEVNYSGDVFDIKYQTGDATRGLVTPMPDTTTFSKANPGFISWFEFGDGKFTFLPNPKHIYLPTNGSVNPLLKVSGMYEGPVKPPHRVMTTTSTASSGASSLSITGILPINTGDTAGNWVYEVDDDLGAYNVRIISNVNDVSGKDTMHFAISYLVSTNESVKYRKGSPWKLVFVYNKGISSFLQTKSDMSITDPQDGITKVPFIRVHNSETIDDNKLDTIVFSNLSNSNQVKTVFVTLIPNGDESTERPATIVKAYLVKDEKDEPSESNSTEKSLENRGDRPHDPNFIHVDYYCLKPPTKGKKLRYHIHFQNTGTGKADDSVRVEVTLPILINTSAIAPYNTLCNLKTRYGKTTVSKYKKLNLVRNYSEYQRDTVYYENTLPQKVIFNIARTQILGNEILQGMDTANPNYMNDPKTMGDIYFTIKLENNYIAGTSLDAQASIIFDTELPVVTNTASLKVRDDCEPRPHGDAPCKCEKQVKPCNCGNGKRGFWKWLKEKCD